MSKAKQEIVTKKQADALREQVEDLQRMHDALSDEYSQKHEAAIHRNWTIFMYVGWFAAFGAIVVGGFFAVYMVNYLWAETLKLWS